MDLTPDAAAKVASQAVATAKLSAQVIRAAGSEERVELADEPVHADRTWVSGAGLPYEFRQPGRITSYPHAGTRVRDDRGDTRTVTDIVDELKWRGLFAQSTDEDALR
ncbi:hypothetical protein NGM37_47330, partial [Streptomyces sp. TRM76130]|nr:hypothetical protein [Streptomyces sp. TRM76130]